ncbi:hypothetical protein ACT3QQ_12900, partial [Psychrobacter sp. AOP7-A1-24]
ETQSGSLILFIRCLKFGRVTIGEPTSMQIALGHKGKAVYQARCSGENGHSSMAPNYRNAIHVGKHPRWHSVKCGFRQLYHKL